MGGNFKDGVRICWVAVLGRGENTWDAVLGRVEKMWVAVLRRGEDILGCSFRKR